MFRRQTDQVYEMLQQVQRQMSNAGDGGSSWSSQASQQGSAVPPANRQGGESPLWPTPGHLRPPGQAPDSALQPHAPQPVGHAPGPSVAPALREQSASYMRPQPQPRGISLPLASVLLLLWILTIGVSYMIGRQHEASSQALGPVGYGSGDAGSRTIDDSAGPSAPSQPGGVAGLQQEVAPLEGATDVLILKSVRAYDPATLQRWEAEAEKLNDISREDPRLPAYFAVRKARSGGLQLVFGKVDGRFGVNRAEYEQQTKLLRQAAYAGARWADIR